MRKVSLHKVEFGAKLAKTIFNADGRVLLCAGVVLRDTTIEMLKDFGIEEIYIEENISISIKLKHVLNDRTRSEARASVRQMMGNYVFVNSVEIQRVKKIVESFINLILSNDEIVSSLTEIKTLDTYTFAHSVNVCVLSLIVGIEFGYDKDKLKDLGIGAILHDIGKMNVPKQILKKPDQLLVDEFEEIKKHTVYGYEMLSNFKDVSVASAVIALSHHERFDGSGYPLRIKGRDIHEFARIVAVVDVYDALTSDRVYRKKIRPQEVFEYMTTIAKDQFELRVLDAFTKYVLIYPPGSGVILNSREKGVVIKANNKQPTKPLVRIVLDKNFNRLKSHHDVDLSLSNDLFIIDACEI